MHIDSSTLPASEADGFGRRIESSERMILMGFKHLSFSGMSSLLRPT